jgi:AsmA family
MIHPPKTWKLALSIVALLVAAQIAVSVSARTVRVHNYLTARLETAFGRPVHVRHFDLEILPSPRIYATDVSVGEDPAFGYEYFLHAEHLAAGLHWSWFLRGHFEFGALSLGQPSLTLVRNMEGRWNLEDWLPPTRKIAPGDNHNYGPARAPMGANRLERIEFDDGRIDFKSGDVKQPFALTGVKGSVEQISTGRWQLQLEAQPWRSGVPLQSSGTIQVHGDVAGTSARLQPASLAIRWDKVSLADLFRLLRGKDYGIRGTFDLDATAKSGASATSSGDADSSHDPFVPGDWSFSLKAFATQIHRWDLTERSDNPALTANVQGRWNVALGKLTAEKVTIESPISNLHGSAQFGLASNPSMQIRFDSSSIQGADMLSWYRAFYSGVAQEVSFDQFFSGSFAVQGWPPTLQALNVFTPGGSMNFQGVDENLRLGAGHAVLNQSRLTMDPLHISLLSVNSSTPSSDRTGKPGRGSALDKSNGEINLSFIHDLVSHSGAVAIQGRVESAENVLKVVAALGHAVNHGWDLTGPASADLRREWSPTSPAAWNGTAEVTGAQLAAAGLNQRVQLQQARLEWRNGKRSAQIDHAEGFGAVWSGSVTEAADVDSEQPATWNVQLHADRLDATELDRWVGPRARPGWLQRLLPSLFAGSTPNGPASELMRRLNVVGILQVDEFTIEKLKLQQVRLQGALRDLQLNISDGRAQWAGGVVRATMLAKFLPRPVYDVHAEMDKVALSQLPIDRSAADRLGGLVSGTLHLRTAGVGRNELLQELSASGEVHLADLEFRGWDVNASVADGEARAGISHWSSGDGSFSVSDHRVFFDDVRLDAGAQLTLINGSVTFGRDANLTLETSTGRRAIRNAAVTGHVLKIVGPLDGPRITQDKSASRQPAD